MTLCAGITPGGSQGTRPGTRNWTQEVWAQGKPLICCTIVSFAPPKHVYLESETSWFLHPVCFLILSQLLFMIHYVPRSWWLSSTSWLDKHLGCVHARCGVHCVMAGCHHWALRPAWTAPSRHAQLGIPAWLLSWEPRCDFISRASASPMRIAKGIALQSPGRLRPSISKP